MNKEVINPKSAPKAVGPYSVAACYGDLVFISGQMPVDMATGTIVQGTIAQQADVILKNAKAILEEVGSSLDHVLKVTVFITDMNQFGALNEVYAQYFTNQPPARSAVEVRALPKGINAEMEFIAVRSQTDQ
jgi:2-iminobutanoate/2-iminopropanoate deaminase